mmetsp:Transcript_57498/g.95534  ORF Transcript_57498/g.95534 Transcript_57498/m.95534 type:complete len:173 (-) Transcript_57498:58-576(-)|eukprot:CAMPEP_0202713326 /NCGR_PEP_ID=MMETSP1385-20130828/52593_1 /ASSEMBLY_ACC=CAM_ASM_000861 /TAXON_ID=933848 /ORGANISM="Elphidium margaritaceum" /LENGTH=172 /DNA_ID=CAMNT_0049373639 /DNA_START=15 /DNA_END=533 /DNA_ORIENTATION=-
MGCCPTAEDAWSERHAIVLTFMRGDANLKTVWQAFKLNNNPIECVEYDEFYSLLLVSLEILDKIHDRTTSETPSYAMNDDDVELGHSHSLQMQKTRKKDILNGVSKRELNKRGNVQQLQETLDVMAPKLAAAFDRDGDGVFVYQEFKELGDYLRNEYEQITTGYQAPELSSR